MTIKIGINGLGRIGRMVLRTLLENKDKNIEIKHINNRSNLEVVSNLIKHDSIHGTIKDKIDFDKNNIIINNLISFHQFITKKLN